MARKSLSSYCRMRSVEEDQARRALASKVGKKIDRDQILSKGDIAWLDSRLGVSAPVSSEKSGDSEEVVSPIGNFSRSV